MGKTEYWHCKKCGEIGFDGPKYVTEGISWSKDKKEFLAYRCKTCGYQVKEPCKDAKN